MRIRVLPLTQGDVRSIMLTGIDLVRPEQLIFTQLFQPMGELTRHPRHGKERCEEIDINPHLVVDDAGVKIHVRIDALPVQ